MPKEVAGSRMATSTGADYIKCPFFHEHGDYAIKCEGLIPGSETIAAFRKKEEKLKQQHIFCEDCWERCEIARSIRAYNYSDDD